MKDASAQTQVNLGIFILCVGIIAAICIIIAGDELSAFKRVKVFKAYFDNASGLVEGAAVRIGGVEVGRVSKIAIESRNEVLTIAASLSIKSPYFEMVNSDASVGLDTQGLLGDKFVSLSPGLEIGPLPEAGVIITRETEGFAKIIEKSTDIIEEVSSVTHKIDDFASGLPESENMKIVGRDFTESARSMRLLMQRLTDSDSFISLLNDVESKKLLKVSLVRLEKTTLHIESIVRKIDSGQGTLGALINDRSIYEDLQTILGHVDRGKIARRVFIEAGGKAPPTARP